MRAWAYLKLKVYHPPLHNLPSTRQYLLLACTLHPRYYTPKEDRLPDGAPHTHKLEGTSFRCPYKYLLPHKTSSAHPFSLSLFFSLIYSSLPEPSLTPICFPPPSIGPPSSLKHHASPRLCLERPRNKHGTPNTTLLLPVSFLSLLLPQFFLPPETPAGHTQTGLGQQHIHPRPPSNSARKHSCLSPVLGFYPRLGHIWTPTTIPAQTPAQAPEQH